MLGIIFTGGEGPKPELVRQLLKGKNAFFAVADSGLVLAEAVGVKPGCIVGDMDSVPASLLQGYPQDIIVRHKCDKDYTDTELAMQIVLEKGFSEIWIIGGGGGRIDHLFAIQAFFERDIFPRRWITKTADIYCIDASCAENSLSLGAKKNAHISVFPVGSGEWEATSEGLKWSLAGLSWKRGFFGLSNVADKEDFKITALKGRFMIVLEGIDGSDNY